MTKIVKVEALVAVYIRVPDEADKQAVYDFLAANVDYAECLNGISDDVQNMRVTDTIVVDEEVEMDWDDGEADDSN